MKKIKENSLSSIRNDNSINNMGIYSKGSEYYESFNIIFIFSDSDIFYSSYNRMTCLAFSQILFSIIFRERPRRGERAINFVKFPPFKQKKWILEFCKFEKEYKKFPDYFLSLKFGVYDRG